MKLAARLTKGRAAELQAALAALFDQPTPDPLVLDFSEVQHIDSAGAAVLAEFARRARAEGRQLHLAHLSGELARMLELFPAQPPRPPAAPSQQGRLERLGALTANAYDVLLQYLMLCADILWFATVSLWRRRGIRWDIVAYEMANMGSRALGVVGLIAFLVGITIALQSAAQLRQFGANLFVADLIGISITRELGPLMTAVVVAGRSGSAVAAELGTMTITEEIDALKTMGINAARFLLVPKVLAITIVQPLLTTMADFLAISGGLIVAVTYLDVSATSFLTRLQEALELKDILTGLFKSIVFAQLIVTVGALAGLRTQGGPDAVGRSTTGSVVAAIFAVIVADAAASLVFYF